MAATYTVKRGDTLGAIASRHGVTLAALLAANPQIPNADRISVGDRVNLPAKDRPPVGPAIALPPAEILAAQIAALPAVPSADLPDEETAEDVDLGASLARFERHQAELRKAHPDPKAQYALYFRDAVDGLKLANFSGAEVALPHDRVTARGVKNTLPPGKLLPRLLVRLVLLQRTRNLLGGPIRTTSLYRSPAYNRAIGGASAGQHPAAVAIDEVPLRASVAELHRVHERLEGERLTLEPHQRDVVARVAKDFGASPFAGSVAGEPFSRTGVGYDGRGVTVRGGVGKYNSFVHRDLRGLRARF